MIMKVDGGGGARRTTPTAPAPAKPAAQTSTAQTTTAPKPTAQQQAESRVRTYSDPRIQIVQQQINAAAPQADATARQAADNIARSADAIATAKDDNARRQATLEAVATTRSEIEKLPADQRAAAMHASRASVEKITDGLNLLSSDETKQAVAELSRTAEALGPDKAHYLTDPVARRLPEMVKGHGDNRDELTRGLENAVRNGDGALFGAALGRSLNRAGQKDLACDVASATAEGVKKVREEFDDKQAKVDEINAQLGGFIGEWQGVLTEQQLTKGVEAFRNEHKQEYNDFNAAAEKMVATQAGVQYAESFRADFEKFSPSPGRLYGRGVDIGAMPSGGKELVSQADEFVGRADRYLDTPAGEKVIADAMAASQRGEHNFLDVVSENAKVLKSGQKLVDNVATLVVNHTTRRAAELVNSGQWDEATRLFERFQATGSRIGIGSNKLGELTNIVRQGSTMTGEAFSEEFAKKAGSLKVTLGGASDSQVGKAFGSMGLIVGAAALAPNLLNFDEQTMQNKVRTLSDLAGLGSATGNFFKVGGATGSFLGALGKGSLGVGTALGMIDFASNISNGDVPMALTSLASTAGGILMATSVGGPVGTAVGALLCIGAVGGQLLINHFRQQDLEHKGEENLQAFLQGAGISAEDAHRLRDLNGDRQSTGRMFEQAAARLHQDPQQFLKQVLANVPDDKMTEVIDMAERVPRNDDGTFRQTHESDGQVGQHHTDWLIVDDVTKPESVQGWINWMRNQGYL